MPDKTLKVLHLCHRTHDLLCSNRRKHFVFGLQVWWLLRVIAHGHVMQRIRTDITIVMHKALTYVHTNIHLFSEMHHGDTLQFFHMRDTIVSRNLFFNPGQMMHYELHKNTTFVNNLFIGHRGRPGHALRLSGPDHKVLFNTLMTGLQLEKDKVVNYPERLIVLNNAIFGKTSFFFDAREGVVFDRNVLLGGPKGHRFNALGIQTIMHTTKDLPQAAGLGWYMYTSHSFCTTHRTSSR